GRTRRRHNSRRDARIKRLLENLSDFGLRTTPAPRTPPGRERSNGSGGGVCCGSVRSLATSKRVAAEMGLPKRTALEHNPASHELPSERRPRRPFLFAMKINIKRLDHVQVCVPRGAEPQARDFYGGLLGLEEVEKPEVLRGRGGMWYKVADIQLHVGVEDAVS